MKPNLTSYIHTVKTLPLITVLSLVTIIQGVDMFLFNLKTTRIKYPHFLQMKQTQTKVRGTHSMDAVHGRAKCRAGILTLKAPVPHQI